MCDIEMVVRPDFPKAKESAKIAATTTTQRLHSFSWNSGLNFLVKKDKMPGNYPH